MALRMSDVRVGMRLEADGVCTAFSPVTVTALTERGFEYELDADVPLVPRLGLTASRCGGEHYGVDGISLYREAASGD